MPTLKRTLTNFAGLVSFAAIALLMIENANGAAIPCCLDSKSTRQEAPSARGITPNATDEKEIESAVTKFMAVPQEPMADTEIEALDWLLLDLKMGVAAGELKFGTHVAIESRTPKLKRKILQQSFNRLQSIKHQIPRLKKELEEGKRKQGLNHPIVAAKEAEVEMMERYLQTVAEEWQCKTEAEEVSRDLNRIRELFQLAPMQPEVEYTQPSSLTGISLTRTKPLLGYEATNHRGIVLRRFMDTNRDNTFDTWIYFNNGRESYREIDRDFDERVDEVQFTSGNWVRIGTDTNRDSKIDSWRECRLSDLQR